MTETTRRGILLAGGAIGAAGIISACGSRAGGATGTAQSSTGTPTAASSSATTSSSASSSTPGGVPLGPTADVPVQGGKVFEEQQVVVTQPESGTFAAFSAVCPHQGCLVSEVVDNVIVCPCHGSLFNASSGAVEQGPAVRGLAPIGVSDSNGTLILG